MEELIRKQKEEVSQAAAHAPPPPPPPHTATPTADTQPHDHDTEADPDHAPPTPLEAATPTPTPGGEALHHEDDPVKLRKLATFWRNKFNTTKADQKDLPQLRQRLQEYTEIHKLDAYRQQRLCAELREREKMAEQREKHAQKRLKEAQRTIKTLQDSTAATPAPPTPVATPSSSSHPDIAKHVARLLKENGKLRYDLNVRCKVMWQLGETQKGLEAVVEEKAREVKRLKEVGALRGAGVGDEGRVVACLQREADAGAEEAAALRSALRARDEQITMLTALVQLRDTSIENLRREAEAWITFADPAHSTTHSAYSAATPSPKRRHTTTDDPLSPEAFNLANTHTSQQYTDLALAVSKAKAAVCDDYAELVAEKKTQLLATNVSLQRLGAENASLKTELAALKEDVEVMRKQQGQMEVSALKADKDAALRDVERLQREDMRLKHYITTLGAKLDTLSGQLEDKSARLLDAEVVALLPPPYSPLGIGGGGGGGVAFPVSPNRNSASPNTTASPGN